MSQADYEYNALVFNVLANGEKTASRAGDTISVFGAQARYDLREGFPILTTKKVNFEAAKTETLWYYLGNSTLDYLREHNCHKIWEPWAYQDYVGPLYPTQLRDFQGADGFVDQLYELVKGLKENPYSRRHCVTMWDPTLLPDESISPAQNAEYGKQALAPCHAFWQVKVFPSGYMDLHLYQRSADLAVGVPFNIVSYSLTLALLAHQTGYIPRYFIHSFGDLHIYAEHVDKIKEQIIRTPHTAPDLLIDKDVSIWDIDSIQDGVRLFNYTHGSFISYEVKV